MHSAECTAGWQPGRKCHCVGCCENFSTVGNFDKHRRNGECISPARVGLVANERGIWTMPGATDERFER